MKTTFKILALFLIITSACITPIDVVIEEEINVLVIDGFITTENGPHDIRITRSAKFGDIFVGQIEKISRAQVSVRDNTGKTVALFEQEPGLYTTPETFKGEVGLSYSLLVETLAGESYSSFPQTIAPSPEIDEVIYQFKTTPTLNPEVNNSGLDVFVRIQDPADERNYYMWEIDGDYKIFTNPELYRHPEAGPLPKSCCSVCYVTETGVAADILSDVQVNGNSIVQKIGYLQDDQKRYQDAYKIHIKQYSIS